MKKKISVLLLSIFILPIFAFLGCDETPVYDITVFESSSNGSSYGGGTYDEGKTVTLSAIAQKGKSFIGWIYKGTFQITDDETYKVVNTTDSENNIKKSELTFKATNSTKGKYTAVFNDGKMMYTKFDSYRFTTTPDAQGEVDSTKEVAYNSNIKLSQGANSTQFDEIFNAENVELKDNQIVKVENIKNVFKLSATENKHLKLNIDFTKEEKTTKFEFRADIKFRENTEKVTMKKYSYEVKYSNETYNIIFSFNLTPETTSYLIIDYKEFSLQQPTVPVE